MASNNLGAFPEFGDGDVLIMLSQENRYLLHSYIIRRSAPTLAKFLTEENGATLNPRARKLTTLRWRIDLEVEVDDRGFFGQCHFVPGEIDSNGRTRPFDATQTAQARKLPPSVFKNYDNLFKLIYQEPIDYGKNLFRVLTTCMGMVGVGEDMGALKVVVGDMERALLQHDKVLWPSVAKYPILWSNFAFKIHSSVIFKDAVTHLVGKWKLIPEKERDKLEEAVKNVCLVKVIDFQHQKRAAEVRMLGRYPSALLKSGERVGIKRGATGNPSRSVYANDIYGWMALSLFRQWFSQVICEGNNYLAKDGGYRFYKALHSGGMAYLTDVDLGNFYHYFPMSDKAKSVMDNHIILMKDEVKDYAAPLMVNNTHYSHPETLQYLLSAKVVDEDCPWMLGFSDRLENLGIQEALADFQHDIAMDDLPLGLGADSPLASKGNKPERSALFTSPRLPDLSQAPGGESSSLAGAASNIFDDSALVEGTGHDDDSHAVREQSLFMRAGDLGEQSTAAQVEVHDQPIISSQSGNSSGIPVIESDTTIIRDYSEGNGPALSSSIDQAPNPEGATSRVLDASQSLGPSTSAVHEQVLPSVEGTLSPVHQSNVAPGMFSRYRKSGSAAPRFSRTLGSPIQLVPRKRPSSE